MNRADLRRLAEIRIEEAAALLKVKKFCGAYYLAGYAVECGLKACIAKKTRRYEFPDKEYVNKTYTHDLEKLVDLAGLKTDLQTDSFRVSNWDIVKDWDEQARYQEKTAVEAKALYDAIAEPSHGILPWIKSHW